MRWRRWLSYTSATLLMAWPLIVLANVAWRVVPHTVTVSMGIALIALACMANDLLQVLGGTMLGSMIGFFIFTNEVNGDPVSEVQGFIFGAVLGTLVGCLAEPVKGLSHQSADRQN